MERNGGTTRLPKTKRALVTALLSLLEENSFPKITVGDLCKHAVVSRSTFYAHFEDKYQLLRFSMEEMRDRMFAKRLQGEEDTFLRRLLLNLRDHARLFRNLFLTDVNEELTGLFRKALVREFFRKMGKIGDDGDAMRHLTASFYAGGIASMLMAWAESDFAVPVEAVERQQRLLMEQFFCGATDSDVEGGEPSETVRTPREA